MYHDYGHHHDLEILLTNPQGSSFFSSEPSITYLIDVTFGKCWKASMSLTDLHKDVSLVALTHGGSHWYPLDDCYPEETATEFCRSM